MRMWHKQAVLWSIVNSIVKRFLYAYGDGGEIMRITFIYFYEKSLL